MTASPPDYSIAVVVRTLDLLEAFAAAGAPLAAISISAPESRLDDARAAEVAEALLAASRAITAQIGGRPPGREGRLGG